jgi:hypothetical protein
MSGLDILMALVASRIMLGPLHLRSRIAAKVHHRPAVGSPQTISAVADVATPGPAPSSTS